METKYNFDNIPGEMKKYTVLHVIVTYIIQGNSVSFRALSCLCCSIAFGTLQNNTLFYAVVIQGRFCNVLGDFPVFLYSSILLASPQLKANLAAPACFFREKSCFLFGSNSVL